MNRRRPEFQAIDLATRPTVAYTEFDHEARWTFEAQMQALLRYVRGQSLKKIEHSTDVVRRQSYRWLERALSPHPDGRPFGFRALVSYIQVAEYARLSPVRLRGERGSCGAAGALSQLFGCYPTLAAWPLLQIKQHRMLLEQINADGRLRTRSRALQPLHDEVLRNCRAVGLTAADYPFSTAGRAVRSLSQRLKVEMLRSFGATARSAGASHLKGLPHRGDAAGRPAATRPYQAVEFDGHRLDIRLKVLVRDPPGFKHEFEMDRVWLLVISDVCTRVVLAYHLVAAREYSRYDVIKTIEIALEPHRAHPFTMKGLSYGPQDFCITGVAGTDVRHLGMDEA